MRFTSVQTLWILASRPLTSIYKFTCRYHHPLFKDEVANSPIDSIRGSLSQKAPRGRLTRDILEKN
jgi:hypothetical protein